ncbi:MAG: amidohydrolase family protein [Parvularculaceae bacterium]|nr:amidohydrolase family protein [Parvularculaceae bacterium]
MPTVLRLMLAIASLASASCGRMEQSARARPGDGAIIFQSTILTMDARRPSAEAVIVKDGLIVDVGAIDDLVQAYPGAAFDEKYLRKILLPSFVDVRLTANTLGVIEIPCNGALLAEDILSAGGGGAAVRVITNGTAALSSAIEAVRRVRDQAASGRITVEARGPVLAQAAQLLAALEVSLILSAEPLSENCAVTEADASDVAPMVSGRIAIAPALGDEAMLTAASRYVHAGGLIRLSPQEALEAITIDAAFAIGAEAERGSIAPGKHAAFSILDRNPMVTPAEAWSGIKVDMVDLALAE